MKEKIIIIATFLCFNCYAQINFEKGYYLNNLDQKIDCLIKNKDWLNNPTEFTYKLTQNSEEINSTINSVKEFGIYNISKYVRQNVNIDRSSEGITNLTTTSEPIFNQEQLFLKVLVEGKATLFSYTDSDVRKFFYKKDNSEVQQLINKNYILYGNTIAKNQKYLVQLWNDLRFENSTMKNVEKINYTKNELVNYFIKYNEGNNSTITIIEKKIKKDWFNLSIRPGINSSSLSIKDASSSTTNDLDFKNEFSFRFGIEAEFILPFNKNKWAIIIEPTYRYYETQKENPFGLTLVDYKSIEMPLGLRHYFFLNDKNKIFIDGSIILDFSNSDSKINIFSSRILEIDSIINFGFGIGYKFNKYSIEFRYDTSRNVLKRYLYWDSNFNNSSLIIGYTIF